MAARHREVDRVWCSDLQRSYRTAELAFASSGIPIHRDARLREAHYGDLTQTLSTAIESTRLQYVDTPYPGGESYRDVCARVAVFLSDLPSGSHLIVGHRATWYALEHLLGGRDLAEVVAAPWHWQPGWRYPCAILVAWTDQRTS